MKISSSDLSLTSSHAASQSMTVTQNLHITASRNQPEEVSISKTAIDMAASETQQVPPELMVAKLLVERLTGMKIRTVSLSTVAHAPPPAAVPRPTSGFGVEYSRTSTYTETEKSSFTATGSVTTSDGKEIQFDLAVHMGRQYSVTSSESLRLGDAAKKTDPLVINLGASTPSLSGTRFSFDLNSDGSPESIPFPTNGSGFLVLTENGQVTNGTQLFGTKTGQGFQELAAYDTDRNGWIDENDPVYSRLQIWSKSASGADQLTSLKSAGVGAISVNPADTPFNIKTDSNELQGTVKQTGVYLTEEGKAGTVNQIDLTT